MERILTGLTQTFDVIGAGTVEPGGEQVLWGPSKCCSRKSESLLNKAH